MTTSTSPEAGVQGPTVGHPAMTVLLVGRDPDRLREYVAPLCDRDDATVTAEADERAAIDRLESGGLDCLVAAYDPSSGQGMQLLDHLREADTDVPVILLPSTETTVIDSRNFVVDVASVVEPDETVSRGGLTENVVETVDRKRTSVVSRRRSELEGALRRLARDAAGAEGEDDVAAAIADRFGGSDAVDGAWVTALADGEVDVRASGGDGADAVPSEYRGVIAEAVRGALTLDGPQVATHGDHAFAAVPVETSGSERWAVTLAAESRYAFTDAERRVLDELRDTLARSLAAVEARQTMSLGPESRAAFTGLVERLDVPVVAYDEAGWITTASRGFAGLVDGSVETLRDEPVWEVLSKPRIETFDDYWAVFDRGDTRTQIASVDGAPRQVITTRIVVDETPYNVALAVAPDADADTWLAEVLAYELRHWVGVAEGTAGDDRSLASVADRVESALKLEASASGDGEHHVTPRPIGRIASEAWSHVLGTAGSSEVRGGRTVLADRTVLFRLFTHLFRTLLTYGEASSVDVGTFDGGFFVEDDGSGIHHTDRAYAESATMTDAKSGASIRVARRLAKRHGWRLAVDANETGGTRFVVTGLRDGSGKG